MIGSEMMVSCSSVSSVEVPMGEVIKMNADVYTVDELLKRSCCIKKMLILGFEDDSVFFGMSGLNKMEIIYLLEKCKHMLMLMED